ncbi:MAG: hypothetical protein ACK57T_01265, partial [Dolichospermum sp.]
MQNLHKLLKTENSELAKILRFNLYGLVAILTQANQEYPIDPGIGISEELLQELDELLQHTRLMEEVEDLGELKESPLINDLKLFQLKAAFNNDPELNFYLGTSPIQSQNDGEIWNEIQRKLLRVPEDLAISWREIALKTAQELGAIVDHENLEELPFVRDEIIYP